MPVSGIAEHRALRVATVTTSFPRFPGDSSGQFVARLAGALKAAGADVSVTAPHAAGLAVSDTIEGVPVTRFRYAAGPFERVAYGAGIMSNVRRDPLAALALPAFAAGMRRAARDAAASADVLHVHWAQNAALVGAASGSTPLVVTVHGSDAALASGAVMGAMFRRAARRAAAVIAVSAELAEAVRPLLPVGLEPDVIPSGVERGLLDRPRREGAGSRPREVVFVGRLLPEKGVAELAEAFVALRADARLTVVGEGPERAPMERRFSAAGVADRVRFAGALPHAEALDVMARADLVVVPSHREGCGLVAIEAAALGVASVVTGVGAMADVCGCPGAVVAPGDAVALAEAVDAMLADEGRLDRCGAEARRLAAAGFTWDVIAERTMAVYRRVLGEAS